MAGGSQFLDGANPPMLPPPSSPLPLLQVGIQLCIVFTVHVFEFVCMYFHLKLSDNTAAIERPFDDAAVAQNGLKKKVLKCLPKLTYAANNDNLSDCAICLAEFAVGDELRVLRQCGHGFHVECIDTWLGIHSSAHVRSAVAEACQWPGLLPPSSLNQATSKK
ncbi:unnamed protein product [Fraxinus pennsylvanica]|uniref:RING-type domain-containing protein n=1 Tax=Fraxinus pennsylvanica TaxID=56036 RepID=A0AAD1ZYJ8_9LAMI|nr:unnamed protein product [Fraxinus pennsylvanica]